MSNFSVDLTKFAKLGEKKMSMIVRKLIFDVSTRIVMRSPVDTGRFRANWQYGYNQVPTGTVEAFDKSGGATVAMVASGVGAGVEQVAGVHYLANNLPYAERLENGWSKQAPAGMVGLTLVEFSGRKL